MNTTDTTATLAALAQWATADELSALTAALAAEAIAYRQYDTARHVLRHTLNSIGDRVKAGRPDNSPPHPVDALCDKLYPSNYY